MLLNDFLNLGGVVLERLKILVLRENRDSAVFLCVGPVDIHLVHRVHWTVSQYAVVVVRRHVSFLTQLYSKRIYHSWVRILGDWQLNRIQNAISQHWRVC